MPGESVDLTGEVHRSEDEDGYETCSSAEEEIDGENDSQSVSTLDREANFLLRRVCTFCHAVWFNSRRMFCLNTQLTFFLFFDNWTMHVYTARWMEIIWPKSSYLKEKKHYTAEQD